MRVRTIVVAALATATVAVGAAATPASAARPGVDLSGHAGTWTASAPPGSWSFTAEVTGQPVSGTAVGAFALTNPVEEMFPTAPYPATGEVTVTGGNGTTVTLAISGNASQHWFGSYRFMGRYTVVSYSAAKGKQVPDGTGSIDVVLDVTGSGQQVSFWASGGLR